MINKRDVNDKNGVCDVMLKLSEALDIPNDWVLTLPQDKSYAGKPGVVSGHGLNSKMIADPYYPDLEATGSADGLLRFTDVIITSNDDCIEAWNAQVPETLVCAKTDVESQSSLCDVSLRDKFPDFTSRC